MAIQILRDLRGLRVDVIHTPDTEAANLVAHLRRIGCKVSMSWPVPENFEPAVDVALLAIEHDSREPLRRLLTGDRVCPTLIAIIGYENPSVLQLVLEAGAHAVLERPLRPFGLLTQLAVARSLWLHQQEARQRIARLERKLVGVQRIQRAKSLLMEGHQLTEEAAHHHLRRHAMSKRISMEDAADAIIDTITS
jgi:AmiR/NasT family two-component response regulator